MRRRGFTLIELLVVIAIIAILAAILFPVFAKAREKARQSSCGSNLKQLALAVQQYAQDYDERMPIMSGYSIPSVAMRNCGIWLFSLDPYIKNTQLWDCPSAGNTSWQSAGTWAYNDAAVPVEYQRIVLEYTTNLRISGRPLANFVEPAVTIMTTEGSNPYYRWACPNTLNNTGCYQYGGVNGTYAWTYTRHNDGVNYNFIDGHVKWAKIASGEKGNPGMHGDLQFHP